MYTLSRNRIYDLTESVVNTFPKAPLLGDYTSDTLIMSSTWSIGDKTQTVESTNYRILAYYSDENTIRLHEYNGNPDWDVIFTRTSQISSFGTDADLSGDLITIGVPSFRGDKGKIESWYFDSEISANTANSPYSGWNMVTHTINDNYDGINVGDGIGYNVGITDDYKIIASTSGDSNLDIYEYDLLYKGNLQVKRFVSTDRVKMIETNHDVKILEYNDENRYNIYDTVKNIGLCLIYPSEEFLQNNASGNPKLNQNIQSDTKLQAPDGPINQVVQMRNTALAFKDETLNNVKYYSHIDGDYSELPNAPIIYNRPETENGEPVFDEDYMNSLSSPRVALSGLDYAYFGEMPITDIPYDFDIGELYIDVFNLHNELDYKYDTDAYVETNGANDTVYLSNTRNYDKIGTNENVIWVSYTIGQNYIGTSGTGTCYPNNSEGIVNMSKSTITSGNAYDYEYLERMVGLNRSSTTSHKSNIYSIEINNSNLNTNIGDEESRLYIQSIVERAIMNFQDKVAPVNTQLWKIIWKGL